MDDCLYSLAVVDLGKDPSFVEDVGVVFSWSYGIAWDLFSDWLREIPDLEVPVCWLHLYKGYETTWWSSLYVIFKLLQEANEDFVDKKINDKYSLRERLGDLTPTCLVHIERDSAS